MTLISEYIHIFVHWVQIYGYTSIALYCYKSNDNFHLATYNITHFYHLNYDINNELFIT